MIEEERKAQEERYQALSAPQKALLSFMESQSEERFAAGWLSSLDQALKGDDAFDWLVEEAGGYWIWDKDAPLIEGRSLLWVNGKP
jgi:hypothetical protein